MSKRIKLLQKAVSHKYKELFFTVLRTSISFLDKRAAKNTLSVQKCCVSRSVQKAVVLPR